jgi:hypothetical protein
MKLTIKEILIGGVLIGLGATAIILGLKNSKLNGEIKILQGNLEELNRKCDDKDRYIGKILTELKVKRNE